MLHQFLCDSRAFLDSVKKYCTDESNKYGFSETGNANDLPDNFKEMALEMTHYYTKYHNLLQVLCDDLPKLV